MGTNLAKECFNNNNNEENAIGNRVQEIRRSHIHESDEEDITKTVIKQSSTKSRESTTQHFDLMKTKIRSEETKNSVQRRIAQSQTGTQGNPASNKNQIHASQKQASKVQSQIYEEIRRSNASNSESFISIDLQMQSQMRTNNMNNQDKRQENVSVPIQRTYLTRNEAKMNEPSAIQEQAHEKGGLHATLPAFKDFLENKMSVRESNVNYLNSGEENHSHKIESSFIESNQGDISNKKAFRRSKNSLNQ